MPSGFSAFQQGQFPTANLLPPGRGPVQSKELKSLNTRFGLKALAVSPPCRKLLTVGFEKKRSHIALQGCSGRGIGGSNAGKTLSMNDIIMKKKTPP